MTHLFRHCIIALALLGFCLNREAAAAPSASATLSQASTAVGEAVDLRVKVSGGYVSNPPQQIPVDGLTISLTGQSTEIHLDNSGFARDAVYTYTIVPQKAGAFHIPPMSIKVGDETITTGSVTLTVTDQSAGGSASPGAGGSGNSNEARLAFGELLIPKQRAYVGEAIPIEIRFYFDSGTQIAVNNQPPQIDGDGFSMQKLEQPRQDRVERNGSSYTMLTFKTALTAVKAGKLSIGPAELPFTAIIRQARPRIRRDPNDPFSNPIFDEMLGAAQVVRKDLTVKAGPESLDVNPLPPGQPKGFSGAVGEFTLAEPEANPTSVKVGDPITLKLKITGRGNFDQVTLPQPVTEAGWKSYPPSSDFKADDGIGISGVKTFDIALVPDEKKDRLPAIAFTYFDPLKERYFTITSARTPITVDGQPLASQPAIPVQAASSSQPPAPAPATAPAPAPSDILYIRTDPGQLNATFAPLYASRSFWLAQLAPLAALAGFGLLQARRKNSASLANQRIAALRKEKTALLRTLHRSDIDHPSFIDAAVKYIQADTALLSGKNAFSIDSEEACASRPLPPQIAQAIRALFSNRHELIYAGPASAPSHPISETDRSAILEALRTFEENRQTPA